MENENLLPLSLDVVAHFGDVLATLTPSEDRAFKAILQPEMCKAKWATLSRAEQLARVEQVLEDIIAKRVQAEILKRYIYRRFYRMIVYVVFSVVSLAMLIFLLRNDGFGLLAALAIWAGAGLLMYYQWVKK